MRTVASFGTIRLSAATIMKELYFDKSMTYGNLRRALKKCCRGVRWKDSVVGYELHAAQNTHKLVDSIKNGTYKLTNYQKFTVYEPKKREIVATRLPDRQIQMALCEGGLYRDFTEHFIYDNCACQIGKGTDFALKRMKIHMLRHYQKYGTDGWVLKCDVHKFFPSTTHEVAKAAARKRISDPKAYKMVENIIDSFDGDVGIGLGSQISQLVELSVLDDLDHFIKEKLHIKEYIRYVDDFILIHPDKEYLRYCHGEIKKKLAEIHLELNDKTTLFPIKQGIVFLQWHFYYTSTGGVRMKMSNDKQGKERRRLKRLNEKELRGEVPDGTTDNSLTAWIANAERGNSYHRIKRMEEYVNGLRRTITDGNNSGKSHQSRTRCVVGAEQST